MKNSKMYEGIKQALQLIEDGVYKVEDGKLFNANGKELGSVDKVSKNIFYVIKGVDIVAHRLFYAYYHGLDSLKEKHGIYYLDDDRTNLTKANLIQLPNKGAKAKLTQLRTGLASPLKQTTSTTPQATQVSIATQADEDKEYTKADAVELLKQGKTVKEVAEITGLKYKTVWGWNKKVKEGKL